MRQRSAIRKFTDFILDDGQTLFISAKGFVRYPIAITLIATATYMLNFMPQVDPHHALAYVALSGVYAREITAGLAVAFVLFAFVKFLATLPLLLAAAIVVVVLAAFGI